MECAANWSVVARATANPTKEMCPRARVSGSGNLCLSSIVSVAGKTDMPATMPDRCNPIPGKPLASHGQRKYYGIPMQPAVPLCYAAKDLN